MLIKMIVVAAILTQNVYFANTIANNSTGNLEAVFIGGDGGLAWQFCANGGSVPKESNMI